MRELVVILPDYFAVAIEGHETVSLATGADIPRLPVLETLLARSSHDALPAGGWRAWLARRWPLRSGAPAASVAVAWGEATGSAQSHWLATPVHLFAGLDSVRLHPQGLLRLTNNEQAQLIADFARVFHDSPWRLIARDRRDLLLAGPAVVASGADPATLLGADPSSGLPQGEEAAVLRQLSSEIELWLHEHPVNLERLRAGQLPVTALWLWGARPLQAAGAAAAAAAPGAVDLPLLSGEDTWVEALWALQGMAAATGGDASAHEGPALLGTRGDLRLQRVCEPPGLLDALQALERRWLAPAAAALRARRLITLQIVTAERVHALSWWSLARWWRPRRPWWEVL